MVRKFARGTGMTLGSESRMECGCSLGTWVFIFTIAKTIGSLTFSPAIDSVEDRNGGDWVRSAGFPEAWEQ